MKVKKNQSHQSKKKTKKSLTLQTQQMRYEIGFIKS
jgi:hypothetical protein